MAPMIVTLIATPLLLLILAATRGTFNKEEFLALIRDNYTKSPNSDDIHFILFTRNNPPYTLKLKDKSNFKNSGFNKSHPTKIIIHGFQSNINEDVFVINKNGSLSFQKFENQNVFQLNVTAYLSTGNYNVIGVDWSVLCEFEYLSAISGARKAGNVLAKFLNWLSNVGVNMDQVHLVGHSLGAHVAGIAGSQVKNGKVGRITVIIGLDPAGPGFKESDPNLKLDSNDAKIVDVIHTYMKVLSIAQPVGHVDFYPNGGRWQPGCPDVYDFWHVSESLLCNHARAYYFFAETILNKQAFRSKRCNSVEDALYNRCSQLTDVYMGQPETYKFGLYYVPTRDHPPYSLPGA